MTEMTAHMHTHAWKNVPAATAHQKRSAPGNEELPVTGVKV